LSLSQFDETPEEEADPSLQQQQQQQQQRNSGSSSSEEVDKTADTQLPPPPPRNITAIVDKKIRVSKAKAEIDRILKGPDAPFDMEHELQKVVSIAPPVTETLEEEELDSKVSQLEQDLYQAVKQQDYEAAAATKKEISQMHIDDCGAVLQVNAAFYRAFSEKSYRSMQGLWLKDGTSTCIHPSHKPLVGSKAVLQSWKRMFEVSNDNFHRNWMEPSEIHLAVKGANTAVITCNENVYARRFVRGQRRETELVNKLTTTNLFRKVGGRWFLSHHHASWHADSEAAKQALRGASSSAGKGRRAKMRPSKGFSERSEQADNGIGMDGILGMENFGPLLGSSKGEDDKKPKKRIVAMGNLSDILNGNLGDLLNSADVDNDDDDDDDDGSEEGIISFARMDEDDDDDDDDDELELVHDDDEGDEDTGSEAVTIIRQSPEPLASGKSSSDAGSAPKDALRQNCISALRKLCEQGSISPKQKRVLLTDIITCSSKGEFSHVEVAYELLCGEGEDKDAAEEEFADQCRVFAHSLPEPPTTPSQL
jgi:hypothetical protein